MTPAPLDSAPTQARRGIHWLVVAHVAVGFLAALLLDTAGSKPGLASLVIVGFSFGQASLLGIWLGLGTSPHIARVMGVALGVTVIYLSIGLGSGDRSAETLMVLGMSILLVSTPLLVAHYCRIVIQVDSSPTTLSTCLRFSIHHLLILTFMVACAITLGRIVLLNNSQRQFILGLLTYGTMFQLFGAVPVWLILATQRPVLYGVGLVTISACVGYSIGWLVDPPPRVQTMIALATATSIVVVSLLVVRSCGYRLVRLPKSTLRRSYLDEFSIPHVNDEDASSSSISP